MKYLSPLVLLVVVSLLATQAFFRSNFIPTHDGEYHILRQWQFSKNISEGNIFPIWAPDLNSGYGVPIFEFFYPLPGYIGHLFVLLGFSFIDSVKLTLAAGVIVSAFTFYAWSRYFFKRFPSVVGSIAYILTPYHTVDASIRGSVGEVWALAIAPFALFLLTKLLAEKKNKKGYLLFFSLSAALLLTSHNVVGFLFYGLGFLYGLLFCYFYKKSFRVLVIALSSSLLASTFFWIPLIFESGYVTGLSINNYREHFPAFFQLIFPSWGAGVSVAGVSDQMSFQIGLVHIFGLTMGAFVAFRKKNYLMMSFVCILAMTVFLMLESSNSIWEILSPLKVMQFPWRLLSIIILLTSFLIAYVSEQNAKLLWTILIASLILYLPYTAPVMYEPRMDGRYINNQEWLSGTTTWGNTFQIKGFSRPDVVSDNEFIIVEGNGEIVTEKRKSTVSTAKVRSEGEVVVETKRAYFPGWYAYVDRTSQQIEPKNGIIRFKVPAGEHDLHVRFGYSNIRRIANLTSLTTVLILLYAYLNRRLIHSFNP